MTFATGLIVGTFDPPHRGHALLMDIARVRCSRLIVIVLDLGQLAGPELRAAWLRELHPGIDVRVMRDAPARSQSAALALRIAEMTDGEPAIDVLFTSDPQGELLAARLGAAHSILDPDRVLISVTSAMIRRSPARALKWLEPVVRAHFVPRICIAGSESTGKSTLAARLAQHYGTVWVEEYGRHYTLGKSRRAGLGTWDADEFAHIAFEQQRIEDDAARHADPVLICDTDALATRIWHEFYLGTQPHWPPAQTRIDLYLLSYPDVPFVADAIREGEHRRHWMHERFISELTRINARFEVLQGSYEDRYHQALAAIGNVLGE